MSHSYFFKGGSENIVTKLESYYFSKYGKVFKMHMDITMEFKS